jgi:hypothetical protein
VTKNEGALIMNVRNQSSIRIFQILSRNFLVRISKLNVILIAVNKKNYSTRLFFVSIMLTASAINGP